MWTEPQDAPRLPVWQVIVEILLFTTGTALAIYLVWEFDVFGHGPSGRRTLDMDEWIFITGILSFVILYGMGRLIGTASRPVILAEQEPGPGSRKVSRRASSPPGGEPVKAPSYVRFYARDESQRIQIPAE